MKFAASIALIQATLASAALTPIWEFKAEDHKIKLLNDPVMGGVSKSTYNLTETGTLLWDGGVEIVPSLSAPGFCNLESGKSFDKFPDATGDAITLLVKSETPDYKGFKFSFAANTFNPQFNSFKADFFIDQSVVDEESGFYRVDIPYNIFSNDWSKYTGEAITKCEDDEKVCPKDKDLKKMQQLGLWAEGVEGHFNLEVMGVYVDRESGVTFEQVKEQVCAVDSSHILWGLDDETSASVGLPNGSPDESLSSAICCNSNYAGYAEPRGLYAEHRLFAKLDRSGVNSFYDVSCGVEVFRAPVGRSFKEFQEDTKEHGWPSFRGDEIIQENVVIKDDGNAINVYSSCGTKLGTMETDDSGTRACIDVVCIAGDGK